jgi:ketosteroid isomerase-like protein
MRNFFWSLGMALLMAFNVLSSSEIAVVKSYFESLQSGDINAVMNSFHDEIIWHQPGNNQLSKTYYGKAAVGDLFNSFMTISDGTFKIDEVFAVMGNGDLVSATIRFSATRCQYFEKSMSMTGVDLYKVVDGKIVEAWLFSENQDEEDDFWGRPFSPN